MPHTRRRRRRVTGKSNMPTARRRRRRGQFASSSSNSFSIHVRPMPLRPAPSHPPPHPAFLDSCSPVRRTVSEITHLLHCLDVNRFYDESTIDVGICSFNVGRTACCILIRLHAEDTSLRPYLKYRRGWIRCKGQHPWDERHLLPRQAKPYAA